MPECARACATFLWYLPTRPSLSRSQAKPLATLHSHLGRLQHCRPTGKPYHYHSSTIPSNLTVGQLLAWFGGHTRSILPEIAQTLVSTLIDLLGPPSPARPSLLATVPRSGRPDGFDPREDLAWAARPRRGRNCRTRWDALSLLSRLMARRGRRESPYVGRGGMCRSSGKYRSAASSAIFFASDVLSVHHRLTARPKQQHITRFAHS